MPVIQHLHAREILDSRGRPTLKAYCRLASGARAAASVPSGASTGSAEAFELRDGDPGRYHGLGCRVAAGNVNSTIQEALAGREFGGQEELDAALIELDGTANKSRLGANAIMSVSLAFARAAAEEAGKPLYQYFADFLGTHARRLPRPTINLFSGGKHAGCQVQIQDVLIVPRLAQTTDEVLAVTAAVYRSAADLVERKYQMRLLRADEGGLAPPASGADELLGDAVAAIHGAGLKPGQDVSLAVDVAATHFHRGGFYDLEGQKLSSTAMIETLLRWVNAFPIVSLEDGLAEDDWAYWPLFRTAMRGRALVLGDDLLCTNPDRIKKAIKTEAADALLLKVNQIGTVAEAAAAFRLAHGAGWQVTVSARSGETEDDWLADLAAGWGGDQIKVGSITQSERLAKYNRLLEIESETGWPLNRWPRELVSRYKLGGR